MSTIHFVCPNCSNAIELPSQLEGRQGVCPSCKTPSIVTAAAASPQQQAPIPQQPVPQQAPIQQQQPQYQQQPVPQQAPIQQQQPQYQQQTPVPQQAPIQQQPVPQQPQYQQQPVPQQAPIQQQPQYQQQTPVPQQAPIQQQTSVFPGLGQGSSSVNTFRVFFNFWFLMIFYGMPITVRIPITAGHSGENGIDALAGLFLNNGFVKRTLGASLLSGVTLKCPGAFFAVRDVRVKEVGDSLEVIGYQADISSILKEVGLLNH